MLSQKDPSPSSEEARTAMLSLAEGLPRPLAGEGGGEGRVASGYACAETAGGRKNVHRAGKRGHQRVVLVGTLRCATVA